MGKRLGRGFVVALFLFCALGAGFFVGVFLSFFGGTDGRGEGSLGPVVLFCSLFFFGGRTGRAEGPGRGGFSLGGSILSWEPR